MATDSVTEYIRQMIRPDFKVSQNIITMKDSRAITDDTRRDIVAAIKSSECKNIIITHGTYTMVDTAKFVKDNLADTNDRKIIFIGSFYPLKGYVPSDAPFNIGFAFGALLGAEPGVYVAMNSQLFRPEQVRKDISDAKFKSI
jgi:L-asparaginase